MKLISVILPVYNEQRDFINQSIESILRQTYENFELIIVDDSSSDVCEQLIKNNFNREHRIRYVRTKNRLGLTKSINLGCDISHGEYIARMDSDDVALDTRLEKQAQRLNENKSLGVVGSNILLIDNDDNIIGIREYPTVNTQIQQRLHFTTPLAHPAVMFRKSLIKRYGGYNENFEMSEDLELWLRWSNVGVIFGNIPEFLLQYRIGSKMRSRSHWWYNTKARCVNFSTQQLYLRLTGILLLGVWLLTPEVLKKIAYIRFLGIK